MKKKGEPAFCTPVYKDSPFFVQNWRGKMNLFRGLLSEESTSRH